jgi:hypothetical protein
MVGFFSTEYMNALTFKIKDLPKDYVFYLPNRISVLKDLYSSYKAKSISGNKFAWGIGLEFVNVYDYIDFHKIIGESMYDYFSGHSKPVEHFDDSYQHHKNEGMIFNKDLDFNNIYKNIDFLSNKNIGVVVVTIAAGGLGYYFWNVCSKSNKADTLVVE